MDEQDKRVRDRLRRAEGQLCGVIRMLEAGRSCDEVVTQLMAVRAALDRAAAQIVSAHIDECLATLPPEQAGPTIQRAVKLLSRLG